MSVVLAELDAEWRRLARSPRARRALMRWRASHPALAGLGDFDQLLAFRASHPESAPPVLAALAALAPNDELAARVLLQALMAGLIRLSVTAGADDPTAIDEMISLGWERIRTYPSSREGSVAANVLWDVRKQYRRHREIEAPRTRHDRGTDDDRPDPDSDESLVERRHPVASAEDEALDHLLVHDLVDAQRHGVISEPALRLIVETRLLGTTVTELAARTGINWNTLMARRFRAERRLRGLPLAG